MSVYRASKILRESLPLLLILLPLSLGSGEMLYLHQSRIMGFPGVLLILPMLIDSIGDASSVLATKLTTNLYLGRLEPRITMQSLRFLAGLVGLILSSGIITWIFCGMLGIWIGFQLGILSGIQPILLMLLPLMVGIASFLILIMILIPISILSYSRGWDPDNILCPLATTLGDLVGVSLLLMILRMLP